MSPLGPKSVPQTSKMSPKWRPEGALEGTKKRLRLNFGKKSADLSQTSLFTMFREGLPFPKTHDFLILMQKTIEKIDQNPNPSQIH